LLGYEGEAQQQSSTSGKEEIHAHKGHHQLGWHLGGIATCDLTEETEVKKKEGL
jgi:hypothetical protein